MKVPAEHRGEGKAPGIREAQEDSQQGWQRGSERESIPSNRDFHRTSKSRM